jgi:hypothetical protein
MCAVVARRLWRANKYRARGDGGGKHDLPMEWVRG